MLTAENVNNIKERDNHTCQLCGNKDELTIGYVNDQFRTICKGCHAKKPILNKSVLVDIVREKFKEIRHSKLAYDFNKTSMFLWIEIFDNDTEAEKSIAKLVETINKEYQIIIEPIILKKSHDLPISDGFKLF